MGALIHVQATGEYRSIYLVRGSAGDIVKSVYSVQ